MVFNADAQWGLGWELVFNSGPAFKAKHSKAAAATCREKKKRRDSLTTEFHRWQTLYKCCTTGMPPWCTECPLPMRYFNLSFLKLCFPRYERKLKHCSISNFLMIVSHAYSVMVLLFLTCTIVNESKAKEMTFWLQEAKNWCTHIYWLLWCCWGSRYFFLCLISCLCLLSELLYRPRGCVKLW